MTTTRPTDERLGCDTSDLIHVHQMFRRAFADAPELVRGVRDGDARRTHVVAEHVREMAGWLHTHHQTEDELLWDSLEQRSPGCALHVGLMRVQHASVAELLDRLGGELEAWQREGTAPERDTVADTLAALHAVLLAHLGDEEDRIVPTAQTVLSQREWDQLGEHSRSHVARDRMLIQLGWLLDAIPPADRAVWLRANLPLPVRAIWRIVGARKFAAHRARVYGA
ncbi:MAG TPA: hemerythrin domain-containing protein [Actinotalea sp.]|nr:hemerythrin domain-containing protein [Actinotalea sp.]